jgi:hypothetical protein
MYHTGALAPGAVHHVARDQLHVDDDELAEVDRIAGIRVRVQEQRRVAEPLVVGDVRLDRHIEQARVVHRAVLDDRRLPRAVLARALAQHDHVVLDGRRVDVVLGRQREIPAVGRVDLLAAGAPAPLPGEAARLGEQLGVLDERRQLRERDHGRVGVVDDDLDVDALCLLEVEHGAVAERLAEHRQRAAADRALDLDEDRELVVVLAVGSDEVEVLRTDLAGQRREREHAVAVGRDRQRGGGVEVGHGCGLEVEADAVALGVAGEQVEGELLADHGDLVADLLQLRRAAGLAARDRDHDENLSRHLPHSRQRLAIMRRGRLRGQAARRGRHGAIVARAIASTHARAVSPARRERRARPGHRALRFGRAALRRSRHRTSSVNLDGGCDGIVCSWP